jgi:hypothetical protein
MTRITPAFDTLACGFVLRDRLNKIGYEHWSHFLPREWTIDQSPPYAVVVSGNLYEAEEVLVRNNVVLKPWTAINYQWEVRPDIQFTVNGVPQGPVSYLDKVAIIASNLEDLTKIRLFTDLSFVEMPYK